MNTIPQDNTPYKRCSNPDCKNPWLPATTQYFYRNGKALYSQCKVCKSEKTKVHNALPEVQERIRQHNLAFWQASREQPEIRKRISAYGKAHRARPGVREKKQAYLQEYEARPEVQERSREWLLEYRERPGVRDHMNEQERIRYHASPVKKEQARTKVNNRVARRKAAPGTHTRQEIQEQYARQRGKCYYCQHKVKWGKHHIDHVVPLSRGGSNDISNLVITCKPCNLKKHNKLPHEWPAGGRLL